MLGPNSKNLARVKDTFNANRYYAVLTVFLVVGIIQYQVTQTGNQIFTNCASGQILKNQTGSWICADDLSGGSSAVSPIWLNDSTIVYSNSSYLNGNIKVSGNLTINGIVKGNISCIGSACMYQNGSGYLFYTNPCAITGACT